MTSVGIKENNSVFNRNEKCELFPTLFEKISRFMKKEYLFLILIIPCILFFFKKEKDPEINLKCVENLPFDYQVIDSLKVNLEHCLTDNFFSLEVYRKINERYERYNFLQDYFQKVSSVPIPVEHAYLKKRGVCPKPEFGNNRLQIRSWKKLKSDSTLYYCIL